MDELKFKDILGISFIFSNFVVIGLVIVLYFLGGFNFDEMTTTVALIVPMFSVYTSSIIYFLQKSRRAISRTRVPLRRPYVFVSLGIPLLFTIYLVGIVLAKSYNWGFGTFENFKIVLAMSETIFGVYLGSIVANVFPPRKSG
jgi:hypothetical protein